MIPFKKRLIVVLGMHRSGTSALTRGLTTLGVTLGERLNPPYDKANIKGFFEDLDILELNIQILKALESDWHFLAAIRPSDIDKLHDKGFFLRAVELLRQKTADIPIFGFKDPRVAKLLPFWIDVFEQCEFDVGYVLVIRNPISVEKSLAKLYDFNAEKSHMLWLGHVLCSLVHTKGCKRALVDYDQLLIAAQQNIETIAQRLKLEVNGKLLDQYRSEFLEEGLRHTIYSHKDLAYDQACAPLVHEIYTYLLDIASDNQRLDSTALKTHIKRWVNEFDRLQSNLRLADKLSEQITILNHVVHTRNDEITNVNQTFMSQLAEVRQQHETQLANQAEREKVFSRQLLINQQAHEQLAEVRQQHETQLANQAEREKAFSRQLLINQQAHEQKMEEQARQYAEREQALMAQLAYVWQQHETQLANQAEREKSFSRQLQEIQQVHEEQARQFTEREQVLMAQLHAEQCELDEMRATFSWRWTSPFRSLGILVGLKNSSYTKGEVINATGNPATRQVTKLPLQTNELPHPDIKLPSDENNRIIDISMKLYNSAASTLEELLSYHDEQFVHSAYQTVLGRAPDPEGLRYYLARVRAGINRIEILNQLRFSKEGKKKRAQVRGLDSAIQRHRRLKIPVLGTALRLLKSYQTENESQQCLRALENKLHVIHNDVQKHLIEINQTLTRLKKLVDHSEVKISTTQQEAEHERVSVAQTAPIQNSAEIIPEDIARHTFDVIFAIGCWEGESKRYRVYNIVEGLTKMGYKVDVIPFEHIGTLVDKNIIAHTVVLFRAPFDTATRIELFLNYAKLNSIRVIYDIDDLVFEPDIIDQIDGYRLLSTEEQKTYIAGVHAYRKLLLASDVVTVPTDYIRTRVVGIGKQAFIIPNSINDEQLSLSYKLALEKKKDGGPIRIGYFSGSLTHQADFAECEDALFDLMITHKDIKLRIVGYLDLDERWKALANRIEHLAFQPYLKMLRVLDECDINIAPLQLTSVFCHGKSELKFFEAGLLGIPTIASATDTYIRVIENGINGYTVTTPKEWREALESLVSSGELRKSMGAKAKETSISKFAISQISSKAAQVYGLRKLMQSSAQPPIPLIPVTRNIRIAWVVPGIIIGGGGHRNIFRIAYFLSLFGHEISFYFTDTTEDPQLIKSKIQEHFYPLDCSVYLFSGNIDPVDVVFATHWSTVSAALTARDTAKEVIYFVQDFEPAFWPVSSEYVLAENTYRMGLYHIIAGPWCEVILRRNFNAETDHIQFPIDRKTYYPRTRTKKNMNLIFFAKPEMPRRCFMLGVMALRKFHLLCPDIEIIMFGSDNIVEESLDFPVTIRYVLPTINDLAEMYSNGDIGMAFSTTNPSFIPYEMMACGLPVVDLDRGDNIVNYGGHSNIAFLADPQPDKMAEQIAALLENREELAQRRLNGLEFVRNFPTEEEMAKNFERIIFTRINRF